MGALLLSASDVIAQRVLDADLPVGVVTVALGGVYLGWLLFTRSGAAHDAACVGARTSSSPTTSAWSPSDLDARDPGPLVHRDRRARTRAASRRCCARSPGCSSRATAACYLDGALITSRPSKEVARELGLLPQSPIAPDGITVADLVARGRYPHQRLLRQWSRDDERAVAEAMAATRVADLADRIVDELSGGQRQRVWLAMALAQQTPILLLDEPTTFLDIAHQVEVLDLCAAAARGRAHARRRAARPQPGVPLRHAPGGDARRRDRRAGAAGRDRRPPSWWSASSGCRAGSSRTPRPERRWWCRAGAGCAS